MQGRDKAEIIADNLDEESSLLEEAETLKSGSHAGGGGSEHHLAL